jgi:hypothetical protein
LLFQKTIYFSIYIFDRKKWGLWGLWGFNPDFWLSYAVFAIPKKWGFFKP